MVIRYLPALRSPFFSLVLASASILSIPLDAKEVGSMERSQDIASEISQGERAQVNSKGISYAEIVQSQENRAKCAQESKNKEISENRGAAYSLVNALDKKAYTTVLDLLSLYTGAYHYTTGFSIYNGWIELEDGSIWAIAPGDSYKIANWLFQDILTVSPNDFSPYQFVITNENTGVSIEVNLKLGPFVHGVNSSWIVYIDKIFDQIQLQDGSYWDISPWDDAVLSNWYWDDAIIVGINNGVDSWNYPFVLINVATNSYVAARLL
jgi:hypothetical protein